MGDDDVFSVEQVHELPHDTIRRQRFFIGRELGHPFLEPFFLNFFDLRRHRALGIALLAAENILRGFDELAQHQLRVAQERIIRRVLFVDVALVVGRVNDHFSRRDRRRGNVVLGQTRADRQNHIGFL